MKISRTIKIYAVAHSANRKTGDIAQTYTTENTCPVRCPFKNSGCYAKNYGTCFAWQRAEDFGMNPVDLARWVIENTQPGALIRHNVAGDIATPGTSDIDIPLLYTLIQAYQGRKAYTYTHCEYNEENVKAIKAANAAGFTINASCETLEDADKWMRAGVPAVIAVTAYTKGMKTPAGYTVSLCPAQVNDSKNCKNCELCQKAGRKCVVAFQVHGTGAKKAAAAIEALNNN